MWAVRNRTPFATDGTFVRDVNGAEVWIVAVRAIYVIEDGGVVSLAEEQQDVCRAPELAGEPGRSSLRYDMDLVRTKPGTDVVLHAHAHAPSGQPATEVDVAFSIGPISKQLRVVGDRTWEPGLTGLAPGRPRPFVSMPITYERAWGGTDRRSGASASCGRRRCRATTLSTRSRKRSSIRSAASRASATSCAREAGSSGDSDPWRSPSTSTN